MCLRRLHGHGGLSHKKYNQPAPTTTTTNMPARTTKGDDSIMKKNDHLAALMKQQADKTKQQAATMKQQAALAEKQAALAKEMEEINESIKGLVMEETTSMSGES